MILPEKMSKSILSKSKMKIQKEKVKVKVEEKKIKENKESLGMGVKVGRWIAKRSEKEMKMTKWSVEKKESVKKGDDIFNEHHVIIGEIEAKNNNKKNNNEEKKLMQNILSLRFRVNLKMIINPRY